MWKSYNVEAVLAGDLVVIFDAMKGHGDESLKRLVNHKQNVLRPVALNLH